MKYFDREGNRIDVEKWTHLKADTSYQQLREFDDGKVRVRLVWLGSVTDVQSKSFRDTWPLFNIGVWNYNAEGKPIPDPVINGETYAYEEEAIKAYEEFLLQWTECDREGEEFIEVGNTLAPPPPPDPDAPTSHINDLPDDFAAW